ncbi:hypothetical protein M3689_00990 [Alkalihalophilus marmarensis]|uniref:hypothetical protein n=1 Tax=Alkalihalophilus marmarensis TaxID=521377 RepID=UPI0020405B66|nr:hypothetical protein [Alkalihalophilus marmarensis]MCM3487875.1 hypothetical protein [Alkalihalophilus marmarensis]
MGYLFGKVSKVKDENLAEENKALRYRNIQGHIAFRSLSSQHEKLKCEHLELQRVLSQKDHHIDALEEQVKELERLRGIEKKYLTTVAALKLHLPEVGEME